MRQVEIIHLRSSAESADVLSRRIRESIKTVEEGSKIVSLYRRKGLETDVAIHICRPEDPRTEGPSSLGIRLASALRALGIVEHTIWEEVT